ncbi:MAG TPA: hypothetical protein VES02_14205, partial [Dermatophilaceae bacterium]|nr:hypothetical protein [Dermatophilaceae bacterium]
LESDDIATVIRAARFAFTGWLDDARVLIRGQADMNRSRLDTGLVLIMARMSLAQAITLIRRQRTRVPVQRAFRRMAGRGRPPGGHGDGISVPWLAPRRDRAGAARPAI